MDDFGDFDPLFEHNDGDDDDEDEGNTRTPFKPDCHSTTEPSGEEIP